MKKLLLVMMMAGIMVGGVNAVSCVNNLNELTEVKLQAIQCERQQALELSEEEKTAFVAQAKAISESYREAYDRLSLIWKEDGEEKYLNLLVDNSGSNESCAYYWGEDNDGCRRCVYVYADGHIELFGKEGQVSYIEIDSADVVSFYVTD